MNKQIGELTIRRSADYYNKVAKVLEDAGFVIILSTETMSNRIYIVAENEDEECEIT